MKRIEQFHVGQTAVIRQRIGREEVARFVALTGDDNPLHVDEGYAQTTPLRGVVVHGMLGASFVSTLIGKHLPGEGALWLSQKFDHHVPIRLDDELELRAEVVHVHAVQSLLTLRIEVTNQLNQRVTSGECKVKVLDLEGPRAERATQPRDALVVVTGGSSGIGAAVARALGASGCEVGVVFHKNEAGARGVVEEVRAAKGRAFAVQADLASADSIARMAEQVATRSRHVVGLVNAGAAPAVEKGLDDLEWEDVQLQLDTQVKGAFLCIKQLLPLFVPQHASIVNVGSVVTDLAPPLTWIAYALAKHGVHGLTKCLAEPLALKGVRINTVAPGMTNTRFVSGTSERVRLMTEMQTPLRRIAEPDEIADVIAFLLGPGSRHMTGQTIRVNGGRTLL